MALLGWQTLVFLIPIAVGSLLAIGAAFGLAEDHGSGDHHGAGDHDHDHDQDHGVPADAGGSLAVGRVPLLLRLMVSSLTFGGIGLSVWYLLGGAGGMGPNGRALVAIPAAALGSWWVSGRIGRLFLRRLPMLETESVRRRDLVGSVGRAVLAVGPGGGLAQVHDRRGNLHQVGCTTLPGEPALPPGREVLLVDYDERTGRYQVTANPTG